MSKENLYIDLLAVPTTSKPATRLEQRMIEFLEQESSTESLDSSTFAKINGADTKADYLLGKRGFVAELKTINGDPSDRTEQRLRQRLAEADAPIVFGTVGVQQVIRGLPDEQQLAKMLVDIAGRAVRRHLQKANDQIGAIKARLNLPHAGGLVLLMNDAEPMIDASAITYAVKNAFTFVNGGYPHVTNVWASIESHKIHVQREQLGYPQLHIFRSLERQDQLDFMARMLTAWGRANGSTMERIPHKGSWDSMRPVYEGEAPTLSPFEQPIF